MDQDDLLARYYKAKDAYLDKEDIAIMIEDFDYDDLDEEKDIKKKKLAKKKAVSEAINYFNEQKEKYKIPLESRKEELNPQDAEDLKAYRDELQRAKRYLQSRSSADINVLKVTMRKINSFEIDLSIEQTNY